MWVKLIVGLMVNESACFYKATADHLKALVKKQTSRFSRAAWSINHYDLRKFSGAIG
jgi:hypothetical protein